MKRQYRLFETRDAWLKARENSIGASSLAKYWVTGERETQLPDNIPALNSALRFGSDWEPYIAQEFASQSNLNLAVMNVPVEDLNNGELAWYDNSFYISTDDFGNNVKRLHVSLDAAYKDAEGRLITVEIKTGSAGRFGFVSDEFRQRYEIQAGIEARMVDADNAIIVYVQRPHDWESMSVAAISEWVKGYIEVVNVPFKRKVSMHRLVQKLKEYSSERKPSNPEGASLLEKYLGLKNQTDLAKKDLEDWLAVHKGEIVYGGGYIAKLENRESRRTDYKSLFADKGISPDDVEPYVKKTDSIRLSLSKDKEAEQ